MFLYVFLNIATCKTASLDLDKDKETKCKRRQKNLVVFGLFLATDYHNYEWVARTIACPSFPFAYTCCLFECIWNKTRQNCEKTKSPSVCRLIRLSDRPANQPANQLAMVIKPGNRPTIRPTNSQSTYRTCTLIISNLRLLLICIFDSYFYCVFF